MNVPRVGRAYGAVLAAQQAHLLTGCVGTVGVGLPRAPELSRYPWHPGDVLVLAVDGLVDVWDLTGLRRLRDLPMDRLIQRLSGHPSRLPEDAAIVVVRDLGGS